MVPVGVTVGVSVGVQVGLRVGVGELMGWWHRITVSEKDPG